MSTTPDSTTVNAEQVETENVDTEQSQTEQSQTEQSQTEQSQTEQPQTEQSRTARAEAEKREGQDGEQETDGQGEPVGTHPVADNLPDRDGGAEPSDDTEADDESSTSAGAPKNTGDLVREGEIAADFLEALLDIADLAGDLEVDVEGNRAAVAIVDSEDGAAPRRLVGAGGTVLDALQELTRLAVQAETGERSRLMLDVAGYRSDRRSALVKTARQAIEEVRSSGDRRKLEPMTAFERKVVHDEVLAAGLHSESEGAEPSRYVVIEPSA